MCTVGGIVFSKCGRDKGKPFIIVSIVDEYVYLVDGCTHKLTKPKKKKIKHIQVTNDVSEKIITLLTNEKMILDADMKKELLPYNTSKK